jgi:hypothetical protein
VEVGVTGFLPTDADEMTALLRPGGPLDSFDRRRCRLRAMERFSSDRMVAEYERLYSMISAGDPRWRPPPRAPSRVA